MCLCYLFYLIVRVLVLVLYLVAVYLFGGSLVVWVGLLLLAWMFLCCGFGFVAGFGLFGMWVWIGITCWWDALRAGLVSGLGWCLL